MHNDRSSITVPIAEAKKKTAQMQTNQVAGSEIVPYRSVEDNTVKAGSIICVID